MNENHENHKLLWNELARTGGYDKDSARVDLDLPRATMDCFACEEANDRGGGLDTGCGDCPITWGENRCHNACELGCGNEFSPFEWWNNETTKKRRKLYAKHIANMEWRVLP